MNRLFGLILASIIIFAVSGGTAEASASRCYSILTDGNRVDSHSYQLDTDAISVRDFGRDHLAQAIAYIRALLEELGCSRSDINFSQGALGRSVNRCQMIARNRPYSRVCFVETNLGYFIVTRNFQTTVHLTFNRWD